MTWISSSPMSIEWMVYFTPNNGFCVIKYIYLLTFLFTIFFPSCPLQTLSRVLCIAPICKWAQTTETVTFETNACLGDICYCLWCWLKALDKPCGFNGLSWWHYWQNIWFVECFESTAIKYKSTTYRKQHNIQGYII